MICDVYLYLLDYIYIGMQNVLIRYSFTIKLISLVAENVIQKEHKLAGQQVGVEKYNPKPKVIKVSKDNLHVYLRILT